MKYCESCMMPLGKNLVDAGTLSSGERSDRYCKYCMQNGELCYKGDNLKEFQEICYKNMLNLGMNKYKAKFFTFMTRFTPRWKK